MVTRRRIVRKEVRNVLQISKRSGETTRNTTGSYPFQKLHVDLTGSHRKSSEGNFHLLTEICSFTKYLVAVPIKDKSAISVAKALLNNVYLVYRGSEIQISDNGLEFTNAAVQHSTGMMGALTLRCTPYRPVTNSQVERVH